MLKINLLSKNGRLPELDGIRGMALILVILTHMINSQDFLIPVTGKMGVWLFFVLSAFLLSSYFLAAPARTREIWEWLNYLIRRILRVYPLYVLVILFNFFFFKIGGINEGNLTDHILLNDGVTHFWTMPVEIHFYFVLPVVILVIVYGLRLNVWWTGLALAGSIVLHQLIAPPEQSKVGDFHLLTYLPVFLTGCFLATIYVKTKEINFSRRQRIFFDVMALAILAGMSLTVTNIWSVLFYPVGTDYFHKYFIWYGFAWAAFIWFTINGIWVRKFFSLPFIRIWGVISYSAYLIHLMIIEILAFHLGYGYWPELLEFVIIFALSLVLHVIIERPSTKVNILKLRQLRKTKVEEKAVGAVITTS